MPKKESLPEIIVELANSHDGNKEKILEIIETISNLNYSNKSIKFQIFSPDTIALKDFEWFEVYKEITFDDSFWKDTIDIAHKKIGNVWIDIFDSYGVKIFNLNKSSVSGLKLQSSILENLEVRELLSSSDLTKTRLMINISGFGLDKINELLNEFRKINAKEIILQIGFQAYPTKIKDTGIQKISALRDKFSNYICLADHADGTSEESIDIPIYGIARGADMIEKHICLDRINTKYDHFSSLEPHQFHLLINKIKNYINASSGPFISKSEHEYLEKSIQIPVLKNKISARNIISLEDLKFRRTAQKGISYSDLLNIQKDFRILSKDINKDSSISSDDFRNAKIGVIIAGRLKSSRLKRKALLPILNKSSIQWCFDTCLQISQAQEYILATSTLSEDSELEESVKYNNKLKIFRGHPLDVITRYLGACEEHDIDVIIRVTADCPFISEEIAEILLKEHFKKDADYTAAREFAVGTSCEIINTKALETVIEYVGTADLSEYMTWYFQNNPDIFKVNIVDLPSNLIRNYRLTLDYQEDLDMFETLLNKMGNLPVTTPNIFKTLDDNPNINEINSHISLTYKTDKKLIAMLDRDTKISL